jgi:hypothetical protein
MSARLLSGIAHADLAAEAALDGIYVLRTSVQASDLDSGEVVSSYKALAQVERAFNTDLDIRPIRHRTEDRVRAHVFLRMLSYYITWHMQALLARPVHRRRQASRLRHPAQVLGLAGRVPLLVTATAFENQHFRD